MARTSTYLNFMGQTEEAFNFYRGVFGSEFAGPVMRMADAPPAPGRPPLSDDDKRKIMHVELPITGGHVLMGTDTLEAMGHSLVVGSNVSLNLEPDSLGEARRLFSALAAGGQVTMELQETFWGATFGSLRDRYGVQWMVNCTAKA